LAVVACAPVSPGLHSFPPRRSSDLARRAAADLDCPPEAGFDGADLAGAGVAGAAVVVGAVAVEAVAGAVAGFCSASTGGPVGMRSEEHTSELQSREHLVCRRLPENQ